MRILFLSNQLPYPVEDGGNAVTFPTLKALCERHEVVLLSFMDSRRECDYLPGLRNMCWAVETVPKIIRMNRVPFLRHIMALGSLLTKDAYFIYQSRSSSMKRKMRTLLTEHRFDLIHIDHLCMCPFVEGVTGTPRILQEHNVEYLSVRRFADSTRDPLKKAFAMFDQRKLRKYEARTCAEMDMVTVLSDVMEEQLKDLTQGKINLTVIPCGVDTDYWHSSDSDYDRNTISFLGHMGYPPNTHGALWFGREVFPLIRKQIGGAKFRIIGSEPPSEIRALAREPGVEVTGFVPDIRPLLTSSAVSIFPIFFGGGIKIKLLVSLAMGIPAVSTRMGSEGIDVEGGRSVLFADDPETFAGKVIDVMTHGDLRDALSREGRRLAEEKYTEVVKRKRVLEAYEQFGGGAPHGR